ncbi:MAG: hypothetical protein IPN19_12850 [Elusimicrobia bacterium]|nr:hypothetical protein [Elusimicrobiota bacterium]
MRDDYTLRKSRLLQERRTLKRYFDLATGAGFHDPQGSPEPKTAWPGLTAAPPIAGALRKEAQADLALAQAELALADSDARPDLKLGPKVGMESGRGRKNRSLGARSPLDLPYRQNRVPAPWRYEARRAEVNLAQRDRGLSTPWQTWFERVYQDAVASPARMRSLEQMEKKHLRQESLQGGPRKAPSSSRPTAR